MLQPTRLISTPFAQEGDKTEIQNVTGEFDNSATYRLGFPPLTMQSIRSGGKPPKGTDFNGVLFDITENISFLCKGGRYQYNAGLSTLIGGYPEGSNLLLDDNVTEVVSTVAGNQNNPNTDMTGWTFKPNRTTAEYVLDASGETQQQVNYNGGSKWHSRVGGYQENERVVLTNGDIVKSTVDGNANDPNVDMTGWVNSNSASQIFDNSGQSVEDILSKKVDYLTTKQFPTLQAAINAASEQNKTIHIYDSTITSNVDVPSNVRMVFIGTVSSSNPSLRMNINGSNIVMLMPKLSEVELRIKYDVDDLFVFKPTITKSTGFGIYCQHGFGRGMTRSQIISPTVSVTTGGYPIYVESMVDSLIFAPIVNSNTTGRGISILSSRRSKVIAPVINGSPITGICLLATRSVTSNFGWTDTKIDGAIVNGFMEEGISFDCRGNELPDCSTFAKSTVTAVSGRVITADTSTISTTANAFFNYEIVFQTGKLAGKSFYIGASTSTTITIDTEISSYASQISVGDIFTVEIPSRGNSWDNCLVRRLTTNPSDSGLFLWGAGRGINISNFTTLSCNIKVANLRGIINANKDYCVPHGARLVNCKSINGDIVVYAKSYSGYAKAYGYKQDVIECKANNLHRYRILDSLVKFTGGDRFDYECYLPDSPTTFNSIESLSGKKVMTISDNLAANVEKLTVEFPIPLSTFTISVKIKTYVSIGGGRASLYQEDSFVAKRLNETTSSFGISNILTTGLATLQSNTTAFYNVTGFTVIPELTAVTTFNDKSSKIGIKCLLSASGSGVGSTTALVTHEIEVSPLDQAFTYYS